MKNLVFTIFFGMLSQAFFAQELQVGLELRPRYEYRNGFKTLLDDTQEPASFVSQRSRLNLNFIYDNLNLVVRAQDIRVWGDVATNQSQLHKGIALFEGYAQYKLNDVWSFKIGRQVIAYDNQRILGEVGWAQQGRSHDAFLVQIKPDSNQRLEAGASVSANDQTLTRTAYNVNNYKNMQHLWYQYKFGNAALSVLFLNNGFEFETSSQALKTQYIQTYGAYYKLNSNNWIAEASVYGQGGTRNDVDVAAWNAGASLHYLVTDQWQLGVGGEYLSGTSMNATAGKNKSFNPLFGTNHKFNGLMDYFYVGNHANSEGLNDIYALVKYSENKFGFSVSPHLFSSANTVVNGTQQMDNYLGTEIDVVANYKLHKFVNINLGYSQMFGSKTLQALKGGDPDRTQNWVWTMVTVKPELFSFKK